MVIKIYNWSTKTLMLILQNVKLEISIGYNIKINNCNYDYNPRFVNEIAHKLQGIIVLDLYIESNHIKGFNYQLRGDRK